MPEVAQKCKIFVSVLPNADIYKNMALKIAKTTSWNYTMLGFTKNILCTPQIRM